MTLGVTTGFDYSAVWPYAGARWWKFDFHTHTPASEDYRKGPEHDSLECIEPRDWLLGFMRAEVDCVAVTDHNTGEWIDKLKSALEKLKQEQPEDYRELYLFPGVEITASGGTHILAIMDPSRGSSDVESLLGSVGYSGTSGASDRAADKSVIDVVTAIDNAGAIAIPAHADEQKTGIWELPGNTLRGLSDSDKLFAVEVRDPFKRPPVWDELGFRCVEILGSDSHHPHTGSKSDRIGRDFTWVKMEKPSLDGLRLALLDGERYSVRRSSSDAKTSDPSSLPRHHTVGLSVDSAKLMGRGDPSMLEFSPWFNAIVGGRGTGKSTVVHALRICARRDQDLQKLEDQDFARRTFERFNRVPKDRYDDGGLTNDTSILWTVIREGVRHRVHWDQNTQTSRVEEETPSDREEAPSGSWEESTAQSVTPKRFPLRIFSQGQLIELAGDNQEALLHLIDESAELQESHLEEARNAFFQTRGRIRELDLKLGRHDELVVELKDTERKLRSFEKSGHAEILTAYRLGSRQQNEINRHFDVARTAVTKIKETSEALQPEDLDQSVFKDDSNASTQAVEVVSSLADAVRRAADELSKTADDLSREIESKTTTLNDSEWKSFFDTAKHKHTELISVLNADGIDDPEEYSRLVQKRSHLENELKDMESQKEERDRLEAQSDKELESVFKARCSISDARSRFLESALADNEFVRIELRAFGDSSQVNKDTLRASERSLRQTLGASDNRFEADILATEEDNSTNGVVSDLSNDLPEDTEDRFEEFKMRWKRLRERWVAACNGEGDFGGHFNNFLEREFVNKPEFLDRLLTWFPEDALRVEHSRSGRGSDFAPIGQASSGQRAAAMLAFLLAHGDEPLVLDQPEDDLDNRLIYDLVVRQIRLNKLKRQIIVVTHNPNIVVNGDAEMVHVLDFKTGQCRVVESGSLQNIGIRKEICNVMEGGREAFEQRYRRIAPSVNNV